MHVSAELPDKFTRIKPMPGERGCYSRFRQNTSKLFYDRDDFSVRILYNGSASKHSDTDGLKQYLKCENYNFDLGFLRLQFDIRRLFVGEKLKQFRTFMLDVKPSISHIDFLTR